MDLKPFCSVVYMIPQNRLKTQIYFAFESELSAIFAKKDAPFLKNASFSEVLEQVRFLIVRTDKIPHINT